MRSVSFMFCQRQGVEWILKASACIDAINFVDGIKERQKLGVVKEVCPENNAVKTKYPCIIKMPDNIVT
jgi:hypothetical protein